MNLCRVDLGFALRALVSAQVGAIATRWRQGQYAAAVIVGLCATICASRPDLFRGWDSSTNWPPAWLLYVVKILK